MLQVAKFYVRGGKGETENLADKGCYGSPLYPLKVHVFGTACALIYSVLILQIFLSTCAQGKEGHQAWFDSGQLLMPGLSGISGDTPSRMIRVDSKV